MGYALQSDPRQCRMYTFVKWPQQLPCQDDLFLLVCGWVCFTEAVMHGHVKPGINTFTAREQLDNKVSAPKARLWIDGTHFVGRRCPAAAVTPKCSPRRAERTSKFMMSDIRQ